MVKEKEKTPEETPEKTPEVEPIVEPEKIPETPPEETPPEEQFKGRYSQFAAKTADEYLQKLEEAYANSSTEGQRLNNTLKEKEKELEVVAKIVNANPELKDGFQKQLYGSGYESNYEDEDLTLSNVARVIDERLDAKLDAKLNQALKQNPALRGIEEEQINKNREIFSKFEEEHPELKTDIKLQEDLDIAFQAVAATMTKKGEKVDFDKTLNKAWRIVSDDDKEFQKIMQKESTSMSGTSTSSSAGKTSGSKKPLTAEEKAIADKFGLTEEQYLAGKEL